MANTAFNRLELHGAPETLRLFVKENVIEMPVFKTDYIDGKWVTKETGTTIAFSFSGVMPLTELWSTSRDASQSFVDETDIDKGNLTVSFDTAWAANEPWLYEVAKRYPTLTFEHYVGEPNMDFHHEYHGKDGDVTLFHSCDFREKAEFWGCEYLYEDEEVTA